MKFTIISSKVFDDSETRLCRDFLCWQCKYDISERIDFEFCVKNNQGRSSPIILDQENVIIAKGFKELYKYWNDRGLWLC